MYELKGYSFCYKGESHNTLENINLKISPGDFLVVCGKSGCGKTTLLRSFKPEIQLEGKTTGIINYFDKTLDEVDSYLSAQEIAYVAQDPHSQIVTDKVWHELAFGLENLGVPREKIRLKVSEVASYFGMEEWFNQDTENLSGGQKQLLNVAAAMVLDPKVIILDEPTAQLDPIAALEFLETIRRINDEMGITIIISEHRLDKVISMCSRVFMLEYGEVLMEDLPDNFCKRLSDMDHEMIYAMPIPFQAYCGINNEYESKFDPPLNVKEGRRWIADILGKKYIRPNWNDQYVKGEPIIEARGISFKYNKNEKKILNKLDYTLYKGEIFSLLGGNGSGKTTFLKILAGILRPTKGKVKVEGHKVNYKDLESLYSKTLGVLPQNPTLIFSKEKVGDELLCGDIDKSKVDEVVKLLDIEKLLHKHPYSISGGEQQKVALAKILLKNPDIILLDEATKGMDGGFKKDFAATLKNLKSMGKTIFIVSHDIEFCARVSDRCGMLFDGSITSIERPREFFSKNSYYTTSGYKISKDHIYHAITAEDIVYGLKDYKDDSLKKIEANSEGDISKDEFKKEKNLGAENKEYPLKKHKNHFFSLILALSFIGMFKIALDMEDRGVFLLSILCIFSIMSPFYLSFEKSEPPARKVTLISVWIALAVASRALFFMTPSFKPIFAIIIIGGIFLGKREGFIIGSMSAFISNFLFGQGPWTIFQMLAWGFIGFGAGLLFSKYRFEKVYLYRTQAIIYGVVASFLFHGLITDIWTILFIAPKPNVSVVIAVYSQGILTNSFLAISTAITLFLIYRPMMRKLSRLDTKYGIIY